MAFTYRYERMATTADVVILDTSSPRNVLVIKRGNEPHKGLWALPGGHVDMDETFEAAARREAMEEVGLTLDSLTPVGHFDRVDRDPSGRTVTIAFLAVIEPTQAVAGDDAAEAAWKPAEGLAGLAFDHDEILQAALSLL